MTVLRRMARLPARRTMVGIAVGVASLCLVLTGCVEVYAPGDRDLEVLWPRNNVTLMDEEVLSVRMRGYDLNDYEVYWYVDDSREWRMWNDWQSRPRQKIYVVDTWYWDWRGDGPYTVGFIAEDRRGRELAHQTVRVFVR